MGMGLRGQLELSPATISDFIVIAEARFREASDISHQGHYSAAIYLAGYAAEMWLKAAAFTIEGARPSDIVEPRLAPARRWLARHPLAVDHENYHSLLFWATYLRERRRASGNALPRMVEGELMHHVRRLYAVWWVEMRYHSPVATALDWERAHQETAWLRQKHSMLVR